jgi:hypothetical protein
MMEKVHNTVTHFVVLVTEPLFKERKWAELKVGLCMEGTRVLAADVYIS